MEEARRGEEAREEHKRRDGKSEKREGDRGTQRKIDIASVAARQYDAEDGDGYRVHEQAGEIKGLTSRKLAFTSSLPS